MTLLNTPDILLLPIIVPMSLNQTQQLKELIGRAEHPLIVTRSNWDGDTLAATTAMTRALTKMGKHSESACANFSPKDARAYSFLEDLYAITPRLKSKITGVLKLNLSSHEGVDSLSYRVNEHTLSLYVTPKRGELKTCHIQELTTEYPYDCILIIGVSDLERLGSLYHEQRDLFFSNPTVVIDHRPENEHFGAINIVDITASSTSEVVAQIIESMDSAILDSSLATTLLAGMVAATKNFRAPNLPPKTFERAGKLVAAGADRELIMRHLFRQKTVPQLKLWGRALQALQHELELKLIWTTLSHLDFIATDTRLEDAAPLMDDLLASSPEAELALLVCESKDGRVWHCIQTNRHFPVATLVQKFQPAHAGSHRSATFHTTHSSARSSAEAVLSEIRTKLPQLIRR